MKPETKNVYSEARAAEVIGPVDSGDRMMAKNGERRVGKGKAEISRS